MRGETKKRLGSSAMMWRFVLPPVIVVVTLWVAMSGATTFYVHWIEQSYQRVFDENIASIQAANDFQRSARRIEAVWPTDSTVVASVRPVWNSTFQELEEHARSLKRSSYTTTEQVLTSEVIKRLDALKLIAVPLMTADKPVLTSTAELTMLGARVREHVNRFGELTTEVKLINQRLVDEAAAKRGDISRLVYIIRLVLLLTGPLVGVWLGWRLSRRLQKSVGKIAVTLQQSNTTDVDLGTFTLQPDGILGDLQQQAEKIVSSLRDAHNDLEHARSEVVRSERLAAVGQLAAGVAHELRNPLTSVKLLLQHAARHPGVQVLNQSKLQLILEEISRMESTIEGLLDFSRQRPLSRTPHDLNETLRRALNLIDGRIRQHRIELNVEFVAQRLIISGDAERLHQVFVNLLINAIEAMEDGGRISLKVAVLAQGRVVRIDFRDTGPGISSQVLPRLFEPFATTKERGTGLGLAVSRRIIEQHEGSLTASNHPEGGAIFTVGLPIEVIAEVHTVEPTNTVPLRARVIQ